MPVADPCAEDVCWGPRASKLPDSGDGNEEVSVQEPEAEDEADGWEIVSPSVPDQGRSRISSHEFSPFGDKANPVADDAPDDLAMGCLDPDCDAQFCEGCERHRCDGCRLLHCERHLSPWPILGNRSHPPGVNSECGGGSCGSSCGVGPGTGSSIAGVGSPLLDSIGLPFGPGTALLCRECRRIFACTTPIALGPTSEDHRCQPVVGTDPSAVLMEAQALRAMSLAELKAINTSEIAARAVARELLLRSLRRLRDCLRPWADHERDWVWRLSEELAEVEPAWTVQVARQVAPEVTEEASVLMRLLDRAHARKLLGGRDAMQVLGVLGRRAPAFVSALGERRVGLAASRTAEALASLDEEELTCCLELLLDAGAALGAAGATGGRRAVVGALLKAAHGTSRSAACLRGQMFWALEARSKSPAAFTAAWGLPVTTQTHSNETVQVDSKAWAAIALEELFRDLPAEDELGLLRQRAWVRRVEKGEVDASRVEPGWGVPRAFPLAVWHPSRRCLGLEGHPREAASKNAPVILRCRFHDVDLSTLTSTVPEVSRNNLAAGACSASTDARIGGQSAGLLLKRDPGMHREQQVGQTLRLLERLIWEDPGLQEILSRKGLEAKDVRATYNIVMTGPGTAMLEFVSGAKTLREVRTCGRGKNRLLSSSDRGCLLAFLRENNGGRDLSRSLARLAATAAVSAVLSFVAGLGDRHHENFMVTSSGRLLHVDYGYALGREPLDSVLIHWAVQGGPQTTTLQYEELREAVGQDLIETVFWPVVCKAYLRVRQHAGLLAEMVFTAMIHESRRDRDPQTVNRSWAAAEAFVARRCVTAVSAPVAERFIYALLWHCAHNERGAQLRDELKTLWPRGRTSQAVAKAYGAAVATGAAVTAVAAGAVGGATTAAKDAAVGVIGGVRELLLETQGREPSPSAGRADSSQS